MVERLREGLAELVGAFVFVLFAAGAVCAYHLPSDFRPEVVGIALAEGCTLAVLLTAIFPLSQGCLNPALTLMLWVFKRLDGRRTVLFIVCQLLGAVLAGLVIRLLFSAEVLRDARMGAPHLQALLTSDERTGDQVVALPGLLTGFAVEMVLTAVLVWAIFAALYDPRTRGEGRESAPPYPSGLGGILPGLAQTAIVVVGFHLTGGSANPARWFGPLVWQYTLPGWEQQAPLADHLAYWAGPIVGALLGAAVYSTLLLQPEQERGTGQRRPV